MTPTDLANKLAQLQNKYDHLYAVHKRLEGLLMTVIALIVEKGLISEAEYHEVYSAAEKFIAQKESEALN